MAEADIALIGLAVMGQNLIMNMNDHGFVVCAYNRTVSKVHDFLQNEAKGSKVIGAESLEDMVSKLKKPRRIILLVKAGQAVDDFIDKLVPLLEAGDIIIDGGNSQCTCSETALLIARLMSTSSFYLLFSHPGKLQRPPCLTPHFRALILSGREDPQTRHCILGHTTLQEHLLHQLPSLLEVGESMSVRTG